MQIISPIESSNDLKLKTILVGVLSLWRDMARAELEEHKAGFALLPEVQPKTKAEAWMKGLVLKFEDFLIKVEADAAVALEEQARAEQSLGEI